MTYEQTLEYLSMILDMEKNIYIQKKTLNELHNKSKNLGIKKNFSIPNRKHSSPEFKECISGAMTIVGIITAIIAAIVCIIDMKKAHYGIFELFFAIIGGFFIVIISGIIVGIIGGLIFGSIIALVQAKIEQNKYNADYSSEINHYEKNKLADDIRVKNELSQKDYLIKQQRLLADQLLKSNANLKKLYDYNIIAQKYRSFVPVCMFYEYFKNKRTYSLERNPNTNDEGAYNMFEKESRDRVIIEKLDIAIDKLSEISENQHILYESINQANNKISSLSRQINAASKSITSSINNQTAIEVYNNERINAELRYMNNMNMIYNWH